MSRRSREASEPRSGRPRKLPGQLRGSEASPLRSSLSVRALSGATTHRSSISTSAPCGAAPLPDPAGAGSERGHVCRIGNCHRRGDRAYGSFGAEYGRTGDLRSTSPQRSGRPRRGVRHVRRRGTAGDSHVGRRGQTRFLGAVLRIHGHPQRSATRVLPVDVHRRRRQRTGHRHNSVRGD